MKLPPRPEPFETKMFIPPFRSGPYKTDGFVHSVRAVTLDQLRARELEIIEACKAAATQKIKREAGYGGQWEGYGPVTTGMTPEEIAAAIDKLKEQL